MMIYLIDKSENITQKICDELQLSKSTVHSILLDFIKRNYVSLINGNNKKEKFITSTKLGNEYFIKIIKETEYIEKRLFML